MRVAEFLLGSIPLLIQLYTEKYLQDDLQKTIEELKSESNVPITKVYDFIVVGGGSGGCVVAGRLSEKYNVLLLEAGGEPPPATNVPWYAAAVNIDTNINYFFKTVPKGNSSNSGVQINHTGKMLGGSGSHSEIIHSRGSPKDYDNWANMTRDPSFNYTNVLKYFIKNENFIGRRYGDDSDEYYGRAGPIVVDTIEMPILPLWFEAGRELGYPAGDPNAFQRESNGFAPLNTAVRNGKRSSPYTEYIQPFEQSRANLTVIRYANVSEILLDENRKAYGVAYTRHGFPQIARASKEIILSAGAFSSPLLLMKSGIGPAATLQAAGIPVKVPLEAVGKNMAEHPAIIFSPFHVNDTSLFVKISPEGVEELSEEYHNGEGRLVFGMEGPQCFIASSKAERDWPNLWIVVNLMIVPQTEEPRADFYVVLGTPKSRGELNMDTEKYKAGVRDDTQLALIDLNMLSHPDDLDDMVEGIKFALKVVEETRAFQSINMTYGGQPDPACSAFAFRSDEYWKCYVQEHIVSWIHMVATNSMGPDDGSPNTSVVDTKFRVRGVYNLRVVDASVIPAVTNANINAPIMMLAEKAADNILQDWN